MPEGHGTLFRRAPWTVSQNPMDRSQRDRTPFIRPYYPDRGHKPWSFTRYLLNMRSAQLLASKKKSPTRCPRARDKTHPPDQQVFSGNTGLHGRSRPLVPGPSRARRQQRRGAHAEQDRCRAGGDHELSVCGCKLVSGCEFKIYRHQTRIEPSIRTELYLFIAPKEVEFDAAAQGEKIAPETAPVSYTHLTLPTNREV